MAAGFELTATLGDIVTAAAILTGAILAVGAMRGKLMDHGKEIDALKSGYKEEMSEIKTDIKKLAEGMTELVRFSGRLDRIDDRAMMQGKRLDETTMLHGKRIDEVVAELNRTREEFRATQRAYKAT